MTTPTPETKWTPEPWPEWKASRLTRALGLKDNETVMVLDDYVRARECVNACASMQDPATEIAAMREALRECEKALELTLCPLEPAGRVLKMVRKAIGGAQ